MAAMKKLTTRATTTNMASPMATRSLVVRGLSTAFGDASTGAVSAGYAARAACCAATAAFHVAVCMSSNFSSAIRARLTLP